MIERKCELRHGLQPSSVALGCNASYLEAVAGGLHLQKLLQSEFKAILSNFIIPQALGSLLSTGNTTGHSTMIRDREIIKEDQAPRH